MFSSIFASACLLSLSAVCDVAGMSLGPTNTGLTAAEYRT